MKYFFNRNNAAVLMTLLFVIVLGASYFFMYVPANEKNLQEQRFRSLQNIDRNIHAKIENSVALMNNLLKGPIDTPYVKYLSDHSKEKFTLSLPGKQPLQSIKDIHDSGYTITVNNLNREIVLLLVKRRTNGHDTTIYDVAMKWSFEQFLGFLLPQNVFDEYIIFSNGEEVYETFPSGISRFKDSLTGKKNGMTMPAITTLNISGVDYKLFSQPVSFSQNNEWVITGLLSAKRYQQDKTQLPANGILLLVTVLFIIIVIFPWLKLYQMGSRDRLTVSDGILSIVVSMLLMSLLFFTFFRYNTALRPDSAPGSKDTLAGQITKAFKSEIDAAWQKLHAFDMALQHHPGLFGKDIINLNKDNIENSDHTSNDSLKTLQAIAKKISLNQVFWLDENGREKINWITDSMNSPHGNFRHRDYFEQIIQNHGYLLPNDQRYYLDQIVSWTSGSFTSVVSAPSKVPGQAVAAMSFTMRSLDKPVLPEGYLFAIIDNTGKVLYHSDVARNLNENLVAEFSENESLISCLQARTGGSFRTRYFSKEYNIAVEPVENLPYFIVIFDDTSYKETRDMEIYSFTFSMMLLLFGFLIFQLFVVLLASSKRSFFKKQSYDTSWIGPKISSHHEYNLAALGNVIITLLALSFFHISTFLTYLFILVFSVSFISIFLTSLFARRYKKNNQVDNYKFKMTTLRWLFIFVIIIEVAAIRSLDGPGLIILLVYELLSVGAGFLLYTRGNAILAKLFENTGKHFFRRWNYARSFSLMALTRLIITSGLPVVFFYISSYDFEQNVSIRYRQLQYANKLPDTLHDKQPGSVISGNDFARGFYYDGAWIKDIQVKKISAPAPYSHEENITASLLGLFRVNLTAKAVNEEKFFITSAGDNLFFYNPLLKDACKNDSVTTTYRQTSVPGQYLAISASGLNYRLPSVFSKSSFNGFLFWILLFATLIIFYFIIYKITCKLFCLELPDLSAWSGIDKEIISNSHLNNLLFIIGLPGSGKLSLIKKKIENKEIENDSGILIYDETNDEGSNVFIADFINIPDEGSDRETTENWKTFVAKASDKKNKLIIVNHFEYNIQDAVTSRMKLHFLQKLMLDNNCKIIILSTIHPAGFLDSVMNQSLKPEEKSATGQDLEKWHVLLGHYRIVIYPLQAWSITNDNCYNPAYKEIYKETQRTHFLGKIQQYGINEILESLPPEVIESGDLLALKLQVTAHYFYMYIWQSLTKEEKFLLYDLAEDNLVNSFDDHNLNMLLAKAIIIRPDGTPKLFNKGFRNFILTAIGNSEAMKIKKTIQDNGNWNRLKTPLLIVILAILTFLLTSQQEAYTRLISYVAALTAGVPTILKLFSIFNKPDQKKS